MAREVDGTGEPCTPSFALWGIPGGDIVQHDEETERLSLAAISPAASDSAFASGSPPSALDSASAGVPAIGFKHPFFG